MLYCRLAPEQWSILSWLLTIGLLVYLFLLLNHYKVSSQIFDDEDDDLEDQPQYVRQKPSQQQSPARNQSGSRRDQTKPARTSPANVS